MSVELKVKSKHLSEEARIIRFEENKLLKQYEWAKRKHYETGSNDEYAYYSDSAWRKWNSLNNHRRWDVRNENRATFLARAYIAGKPYNTVEAKRKEESIFLNVIVPRIVTMVGKYGTPYVSPKVYSREKGGMIDNPALKEIKDKIIEWAKLPEDK
jgi:hypothetical protein